MKRILIFVFAVFLFAGCEEINSLPTPSLSGGKGIESPGYDLIWSNCGKDIYYELQESASSDFTNGTTIYQGPETQFNVPASGNYYRVRAEFNFVKSEWSNIVRL